MATLTNVPIAQVNNAFDGARRFRLRYDTPVVRGWMLSTSYGVNILSESDDSDYQDVDGLLMGALVFPDAAGIGPGRCELRYPPYTYRRKIPSR